MNGWSLAPSVHEPAGGDADDRERRRNCPACGTRIPADSTTCEYCGESGEAGE